MRTYRLFLSGLGNVGRSFLAIMQSQASLLARRYGVALRLVAAADSGGAAIYATGLDPATILALKQRGQSIAALPESGIFGIAPVEVIQRIEADILLEATPVNLKTGQPGLDTVRAALRRGMHAVLANKGPLALAYTELADLSDMGEATEERGDPRDWPALRFSACVGGALPTIAIGRRDLAGATIVRVEAVLNGTTQGILRAMEQGSSYADALAEMQRRGLAETDPSLDVEGWDAASKLTILANAVLRQPTTLADVAVRGITDLTTGDLRAALDRGERIVLLCLAERRGGDFHLSVQPTSLPLIHPLARMSADEMGVVYYTDITGRQTATTLETDPTPTAAAMLRDILDIAAR
ncbi:homoserine dehydrogenase [Roseiflexus castenholzii]|uniref:Homoserine dehydrogenase n=1 Tax=Roseiflexus castenholzii (strain DSM 13941 / HLO8) TaxID=383372 RepID=A7NJI2_ROSCS|nr:homoserine dehydrogenase [Roseiflexus castenholzii]ABU57652.1 Homoserine dehydrogenase [Roseiflexus castenholzii DSM 13941]